MVWEISLLALCVIIAVLLIIFRKTLIVKKYWRYALILLPFVVLVTIKIIISIKTEGTRKPTDPDPLMKSIADLKDNLQEAHLTSVIEVSAAKAKDQATLTKLQQVTAIPDQAERTKQLTAMVG